MRPVGCPLPPSSSLPPLRRLGNITEDAIFSHLQSLSALYCPLAFNLEAENKKLTIDSLVDSGYVSEAEEDDDEKERLEALLADPFERNCAERWLTGFMARAVELSCFTSETTCQRAIDQASWVLESFYTIPTNEDEKRQEELADFTREFAFEVTGHEAQPQIKVRLNDGLAGRDSSQPDDVGLQSWGASIVVSKLLCSEPERLHLTRSNLGTAPRIIELGAGTGLVSLVAAKLLPHLGVSEPTVIATDYHPAVLANLRSNINSNFPTQDSTPIQLSPLDWSAPFLESPLDKPADMLIATDVVYAPEHATWLRDCSTLLLAPHGVFWLVTTVRQNGRFEGVNDTVEAAFAEEDRPRGSNGRQLTILHAERLEKTKSIGRGDESGYKLFRIGWA